jgi:hypothetical protein
MKPGMELSIGNCYQLLIIGSLSTTTIQGFFQSFHFETLIENYHKKVVKCILLNKYSAHYGKTKFAERYKRIIDLNRLNEIINIDKRNTKHLAKMRKPDATGTMKTIH